MVIQDKGAQFPNAGLWSRMPPTRDRYICEKQRRAENQVKALSVIRDCAVRRWCCGGVEETCEAAEILFIWLA
jgi:hypothetical protein